MGLVETGQTLKVQPHAREAAEDVIAAVIGNGRVLPLIETILQPGDFYVPAHQAIYTAALNIYHRSEPIDTITVHDELRRTGKLNEAGGLANLTEISTNRLGSTANVEYHARIVKQNAIRRELIRIGYDTIREAQDDTGDPFEALGGLEMRIDKLNGGIMTSQVKTTDRVVSEAIRENERPKQATRLTALPEFEEMLEGVEPGQLVVVAGRPGMGKSILANMVTAQVVETGAHALFWSLEMTNTENVNRLTAALAKVKYQNIKNDDLTKDERERVNRAWDRIAGANITFKDQSGITARDVRSLAITLKRTRGLDVVLIDHGGLLRHMNPKGNTVEEIGYTSALLKQVAKELNVVVVLLWQLSREVERRGGSFRPRMSDLRASGTLEENADKIVFVYRPEYYNFVEVPPLNGNDYDPEGLVVFFLDKNRQGRTGSAVAKFVADETRFERYTPPEITFPDPDHRIEPVKRKDGEDIPF